VTGFFTRQDVLPTGFTTSRIGRIGVGPDALGCDAEKSSFLKGSSSMTAQRTSPIISLIRLTANPVRMQLRRLALIAAISAAAFYQSRAVSADDGAIAESLNLPPQIINFVAERVGDGTCVVSGVVIDDDMETVILQFGGYLQGVVMQPAADGSFSYTFFLPPGQFAYIAARALAQDDGTYSQPAETVIRQ
jgi:hypothetical protein